MTKSPAPNYDRYRACNEKITYNSRFEAAQEMTKVLSRSKKKKHAPVSAYHCPHCGGYHWGRTPRWAR